MHVYHMSTSFFLHSLHMMHGVLHHAHSEWGPTHAVKPSAQSMLAGMGTDLHCQANGVICVCPTMRINSGKDRAELACATERDFSS